MLAHICVSQWRSVKVGDVWNGTLDEIWLQLTSPARVIFHHVFLLWAEAHQKTRLWFASVQSVCFPAMCWGCGTLDLKNLCLSNKLPVGIPAHKSSWRMRPFQNAKLKSKSSGKEGFGRGLQGQTAVWWAQLDLARQVGDGCRTVSVGL